MRKQADYPMLPIPSHDEEARTNFAYNLANHIRSDISPHNQKVYQHQVLPTFRKTHGRSPNTRHEVREVMSKTQQYKMSSALQRFSQEMMWDSVTDTVERQLPEIISKFECLRNGPVKGSLTLDPKKSIPPYLAKNHHHCMAGGYHTESTTNDLSMGAIYDRGSFIYVDGNFGPRNDGLGVALSKFIQVHFGQRTFHKILDMGCTVGGSTVALKEQFNKSEVWGIDIGAPCLRYAHGRAEYYDAAVNFAQENAEKTSFEPESFDLVTSAALLHETSHKATLNIFKECHRILKPGGVMIHQEIQPYRHEDPWLDFTRDWDTLNNNEPFWGTVLDMDLTAIAKANGWNRDIIYTQIGFGPAEAHSIKPAVEAKKVMGASRGARGMSYLCGIKQY
jgi:2-polyprenyl-3-methyl-5-hydroxy-6-metoxy-1,4-benzoquinol methylase